MYLKISINNRCDLSCSFCSQRDTLDKNDMTRLDPSRVSEVLDGISTKLEAIIIIGGEPLLDADLVKQIAGIIRGSRHSDADIRLLTNGTMLSRENVHWINALGVQVHVSIDGLEKSQRPLTRLFNDTEQGVEVLDNLRNIQKLVVNKVFTNPFEDFALYAHTMKTLIPNIMHLSLVYDNFKHDDLNIQHLFHASRQLLMLRKLDPDFHKWIEFGDFWTGPEGFQCDCTSNHYLYADGTLITMASSKDATTSKGPTECNQPMNGCSKVADVMGLEVFNSWRKHLDALIKSARIDT